MGIWTLRFTHSGWLFSCSGFLKNNVYQFDVHGKLAANLYFRSDHFHPGSWFHKLNYRQRMAISNFYSPVFSSAGKTTSPSLVTIKSSRRPTILKASIVRWAIDNSLKPTWTWSWFYYTAYGRKLCFGGKLNMQFIAVGLCNDGSWV